MVTAQVWQTRIISRPRSGDDASSVSSRSTVSDNEDQLHVHVQELSIKAEEPGVSQPRHNLNGQIHGRPVQSPVEEDPLERAIIPSEQTFVGLFIKLCLWSIAWRKEGMRERPLKQKYRTRQGLQMKAAQIGSGASFTVTKRHTFENPPKVVVMKDTNLKFDRIGRPNDGAVFVSVATEIEILGHKSLYDHANIVTLLDVRWDHPSMYKQAHGPTLYLEYANMGTLSHYFEWHPTQASNMSRTSNILFDVCLGLQALHRYGITHGDLKPSNVLIFEELGAVTAKLSDFGCSVIQRRTSGPTSELTGFSPPWDAPEAGEVVPSDVLHKSDIYSFGLMYWWCRLWGAQGSKPMTGGEGAFISGTTADLKALKKAEDLGPMMHGSILAAMRNSGCYGLDELELSLVASATLNLRPEERSLETVLEAMQQ